MGNNLSLELSSDYALDLHSQITIQLRSNHYPPIPLSMVEPCIEAINACNEDDYERLITLPESITWRGKTSAPANAVVESHHLNSWINLEEE
jgi:hypothetical protein